MKCFFFVLFMSIIFEIIFPLTLTGQEISRAFEFRFITDNPAADGETDFKGETSIFTNDERISFLWQYAEYAKGFFNDTGLDKEVVNDEEIKIFLRKLKEQPLQKVRDRIPLKEWKWIGYKEGDKEKETKEMKRWSNLEGTEIEDGGLVFSGEQVEFEQAISPQTWRFFLQWKVKIPRTNRREIFCLGDKKIAAVTVGFNEMGRIFYCSEGKEFEIDGIKQRQGIIAGSPLDRKLESYTADTWYEFKVEVDFTTGRYNFYVNNQLKADYVKFRNSGVEKINTFSAEGIRGEMIDDIWGVGYLPTGNVNVPYSINTFIDEDFEEKPDLNGWNKPDYDDSKWRTAELPKVHGGERYAGEDLYLRKTVYIGDFSRAILNVETLDPAGEIWVNGEVVAVQTNRHPAQIDISNYVKSNQTNLIAVRVKHFYLKNPMILTSDDHNIGWFAGKISIDLTAKTYIENVFVSAKDVSNPAHMQTRMLIKNEDVKPFKGNMVINLYHWFPEENIYPSVTVKYPVSLRAWSEKSLEELISVPNPKIWSYQSPNLYKVEVILENETGQMIDDYVVTAGIRTVSQEGGTFRINNKPEMLNGAQILGFRMPLDKNSMWNRCAPVEWLAKELLMVKKMNGNMMRMHVHSWQYPSPEGGINDPRIPELCDQLGLMLIWGTTAWIREGEGWGIDFEGYPKYMRQVYNHPSIVMWEASNHPNRFKDYDVSESNLFVDKVYRTIFPVDRSRLISTTSHIAHMHFGNDLGTVDWKGNPMIPCSSWTAPMITRGNQDAVTGYGAEWMKLRTWPPSYQKNFLDSKERAYFNFEHEESIGQPNWSLIKGKPWYLLPSYEWTFD